MSETKEENRRLEVMVSYNVMNSTTDTGSSNSSYVSNLSTIALFTCQIYIFMDLLLDHVTCLYYL